MTLTMTEAGPTSAYSGWLAWDVSHAERVARGYRALRDHVPGVIAARLLLAHLPHDLALHPRLRGRSVVGVSLLAGTHHADPLTSLRSAAPVLAEHLGEVQQPDPRAVERGLVGPLRVLDLPELAAGTDDDALELVLLVLADRSTCPLVLGSLDGWSERASRPPAPGTAGLAVALDSFERVAA